MPPPNQHGAFQGCCAHRAEPAHACHEFALPRGCSPKPSSPPKKKTPTRGIKSGTPFLFPPRLTRAPRGSPAGRREPGQGMARRCPPRAGGCRRWRSSCPPLRSRCELGRGQEAVKVAAGGTGQCRGLAAHHRHRGVPARCPGSRPRAGGSCCARRCWGAGWAPQRCPGGAGAQGTGRCPTASSRGAAAAHPSAAEDGGARGWGRVVPASLASWGGTGHGDSPPHPTHAPTPPNTPFPCSPPSLSPHPCPKSPRRAPGPYPVPRGRCSGVRTSGDTRLASEPTKPLSVSGDTMRCSCNNCERDGCPAPPGDPCRVTASGDPPPPALTWRQGLRGRRWVAALPAPLLCRDGSTRGGRGSGSTGGGGRGAAGGSWWWPRVPSSRRGSLWGSGTALLCGGGLWGEGRG